MEETTRTPQEILERTDPRWNEIPWVCAHCKHFLTMGGQFDAAGWTCKAFPSQILYGILALQDPHTKPFQSQVGDYLYDPIIYKEELSGRKWHYTADGGWTYIGETPVPRLGS